MNEPKKPDIASECEKISETDFRIPDNTITDNELEIVLQLAFDMDEYFRFHNSEYANTYQNIQAQKENLADLILTAQTTGLKKALSAMERGEDGALMKRLIAYENEFPKNHYTVYKLKNEYKDKCEYKIQKMRQSHNYIDRNMYEPIYSKQLDKNISPMGVDILASLNLKSEYAPDLRDIIVISYHGEEKAYFKQLRGYVEAPEFTAVHTRSAVHSNYKGYVALVGADDKIYLGRKTNYMFDKEHDYLPFYNNSDNSLVYISDNETMYYFLYGQGWTVSQKEMIDKGVFSEADYAEFARLQKGVLSQLEKIRDIEFGGVPFNYLEGAEKSAEQNYNQIDGVINNTKTEKQKPSIRKQIADRKIKSVKPKEKKEDLSL